MRRCADVLAVLLALGTSFAYGTANFLNPRLARTHPLATVLVVGQTAALVVAAALVLVSGQRAPGLEGVLLGVLAGAGNALGLAAFIRATQLGPVSVAAAIGATGTVVPVVFGLTTGERITASQAAGIALAIGGAALAAQTGRDGAIVTRAAVGWAVLGAAGLGVLFTALPPAAEDGTAWALLDARLAVVAAVLAGVVVLGAWSGVRATATRDVPALAAPGLLLLAGTLAYAEATARGALSVVSVLASLATVVTVGLSFVVLGERLARVQQLGVGAAIAGTVLLAV